MQPPLASSISKLRHFLADNPEKFRNAPTITFRHGNDIFDNRCTPNQCRTAPHGTGFSQRRARGG
jgi:hypothetical protein